MNFHTDVAHQRPNKFFLSVLGLWPHQKTLEKRIFFLLSTFFVVTQGILQIGGLIMAWEDTDIFMESIPPVAIDFMCWTKLLNFIYNADKMKKLLTWTEEDWKRYQVREELMILREFGADCRKKTIMYAGAVFGSMVPFMVVPLVPLVMEFFPSEEMLAQNETLVKPLMFHVEYLLDSEKWYYYLLLHSYFGTIAYITIVVAVDTILLVYVQHACSLFAIIGYRLEHLVESDDIDVNVYPPINEDKAYKALVECIVRHKSVIKYVNLIEDANTSSLFLQLGINGLCLSFTGFQAVMKMDHPDESLRYTSFMLAQAFPVFIACYPSQCLLTESSRIFEAFTRSMWYLTSIRTRRLLNLMILRSLQPCFLTAGNFFVLDMKFFTGVMRSSLSYLRMLYSFH